jgi:hypothetical protein
MIKILILLDPASTHDLKWVSYFTERKDVKIYFICREVHKDDSQIIKIENKYQLGFLGSIKDFSVLKFHRSIIQAFKIKKLIHKFHIDLFHIYYAEPNSLWTLFRNYFRIPIIITCRGTDVLVTIPNHFKNKNPINWIVAPAYKKSFLNADWITVTSEGQKASINTFSGREDDFAIIRTGVDLKQLNEDTSAYFPNGIHKSYILFPRYIKEIYNHEFCIDSLSLLPDEIKRDYQMVFVGKNSGDNLYEIKIESLMRKNNDLQFLFLEKQSQKAIYELYKKAELIIMTPLSDGSPVSSMEAIALNKPVVLGPLNYDNDIFNRQSVFQLLKWDVQELSTLIKKVLFKETESIKVKNNILQKIDRAQNMERLNKIYLSLSK